MEPAELQRKSTLKNYLKKEMGTDNINEVDFTALKEKIEGDKINKKSEHRKGFSNMLQGKRPKIKKGEIFKSETNFASRLHSNNRNPLFGFHTLSYTISEACKTVEIRVLNKSGGEGKVGIRTKDKTAKDKKDYVGIPEGSQLLNF